jgi:hypothetical protein
MVRGTRKLESSNRSSGGDGGVVGECLMILQWDIKQPKKIEKDRAKRRKKGVITANKEAIRSTDVAPAHVALTTMVLTEYK